MYVDIKQIEAIPTNKSSYINNTLKYVIEQNNTFKVKGVDKKLKFGDLTSENYLIGNLDEDYELIIPQNIDFKDWTTALINKDIKLYNNIPSNLTAKNADIKVYDIIYDNLRNLLYDVFLEKDKLLNKESIFYDLQVHYSYSDFDVSWFTNTVNIAASFRNYIMSNVDPEKKNKIKGPKEFIFEFIDAINGTLNYTSINKSSLLLSYKNNFTGGLKISFSNDRTITSATNYENIFNTYFNDSFFHYFASFCRYHGFLIDKFMPWTIYPDFQSKNFLTNLKTNFGFENEFDLYKKRYTKVHLTDIQNLINFFTICYNKFAYQNTLYRTTTTHACSGKAITFDGVRPSDLTPSDMQAYLSPFEWIRIYAFIRHKEIFSSKVTQQIFDDAVESAYTRYTNNNNSFLQAADYINLLYKEDLKEIIDVIMSNNYNNYIFKPMEKIIL